MPRVEFSPRAAQNLDELITSLSLPTDTRRRVRMSLRTLEAFPNLGRELAGRWTNFRAVLGPWRWMLIVYRIDDANDQVVVVTVQDARSSSAATSYGR
ncbi:MAG: type II toxin-antitoxin system RelE/ParE family toxin [Nitriliruptor sp.]|uniref:type II toxin-antitoxin system RelE/ParE family toxin n=1 Tax=Nitriliruptor sp. TaxID=2448056 RepID=UPI00349FEB1E